MTPQRKYSLCHCFSSSQSAWYFLSGQLEYMHEKGFEIHLLLPNDGFVPQLREQYPLAQVHVIPLERKISPVADLYCLAMIVRLFKRQHFDIIHLHTPKVSLLGSIASRLCRHKRTIYHVHGLVAVCFNRPVRGLVYYLEKIPFLFSDYCIAVSKSLCEYIVDNGIAPSDKITVLGDGSINGIDCECLFNPALPKYQASRIKNGLDLGQRFVIGFLGRLQEDKGIEDICHTVNKLRQSGLDIVLVMVGPDEIPGGADSYLAERLLVPYKLIGQTDQPQKYLSVFDILLFPSRREGFGLAASEANAMQVPVVGYNIFGVCDAVCNDKTAKLVTPGSTDELAEAIIAYYASPSLRKEHGIAGRKRVQSLFEPQGLWEKQYRFYQDILGNASDG